MNKYKTQIIFNDLRKDEVMLMKKTGLAFFVCVFMLVSLVLPFMATEYGQAANGSPVIDGKVDDIWALAPAYKIDKLKSGDDTDVQAEFKVMWDGNLLYVLITVIDPEISYEGTAHHIKDGVEIYLDPMKMKTDNYSEEPLVMQTFITLPADQPLEFTGHPDSIEAFEAKTKKAIELTDKGYIVEASFDLKSICPDLKMEAGTVILLDIQVNEQITGEEARLGAYGWSDGEDLAWQTTEVLGEITFLAAEAEAHAINEPEAEDPAADEKIAEETASKNPKTSDSIGVYFMILSLVSFIAFIKIYTKRAN